MPPGMPVPEVGDYLKRRRQAATAGGGSLSKRGSGLYSRQSPRLCPRVSLARVESLRAGSGDAGSESRDMGDEDKGSEQERLQQAVMAGQRRQGEKLLALRLQNSDAEWEEAMDFQPQCLPISRPSRRAGQGKRVTCLRPVPQAYTPEAAWKDKDEAAEPPSAAAAGAHGIDKAGGETEAV